MIMVGIFPIGQIAAFIHPLRNMTTVDVNALQQGLSRATLAHLLIALAKALEVS